MPDAIGLTVLHKQELVVAAPAFRNYVLLSTALSRICLPRGVILQRSSCLSIYPRPNRITSWALFAGWTEEAWRRSLRIEIWSSFSINASCNSAFRQIIKHRYDAYAWPSIANCYVIAGEVFPAVPQLSSRQWHWRLPLSLGCRRL